MITRDQVVEEMKRRGHVVFETGRYNLNLVNLRKIPGTPNRFDDLGVCFYKDYRDMWQLRAWPITTDPGAYWLNNPARVTGTGILIPGQYRGAFSIGMHHVGQPNQYEALVQGPYKGFRVWRDNDKDGKPTYGGKVYDDAQGLNYHRAGAHSTNVDKWSMLCQVHADSGNHSEMMDLVHRQKSEGNGSKVTLTLMDVPWSL